MLIDNIDSADREVAFDFSCWQNRNGTKGRA